MTAFGKDDKSNSVVVVSKTLNSSQHNSQISITFEREKTYELCFINQGTSKQHIFFEFPLQTAEAIGSATEVGEGVSILQALGIEIEQTAETVKEAISKTNVFDEVYDEMESTLYASFFMKAGVLIIVCSLQCWLFLKMIGRKTLEYKRVSIPI